MLQFRMTEVLPEASGGSEPRGVTAALGKPWAQGFERSECLLRGNKDVM